MSESILEEEFLANRLNTAMSVGVDVETRRVFMVGPVTSEMAHTIITTLHVLDSTKGDIYITLNSLGGSEPDGYAIYDAIRMTRNKVIIEGYGSVQSIAALILQAADVRRLAPNARFMVHNGSISMAGDIDVNHLAAINKEIEASSIRYYKILSEASGLSVTIIKDMCFHETFLDAKQTVAKGLADEIIKYSKNK